MDVRIQVNYFDLIRESIDSLNAFFTSGFTVKNFPMLDGEVDLDETIRHILECIDAVDVTWVQDPTRLEDAIDQILEAPDRYGEERFHEMMEDDESVLRRKIASFVGYKMLQYIADNFDQFSKLINGIYTFDLFLHPNQYKEPMDIFSKPLDLEEIRDVLGDYEDCIYTDDSYLSGLFRNNAITFPDTVHKEREFERMTNMEDSKLTVVKVENPPDESDNEVQTTEAASVNYFKNIRPDHIIYDEKSKKFKISKQQTAIVNKFISALKKCDTTEDLDAFFSGSANEDYVDSFTRANMPFVLAQVFSKQSKYPFTNYNKDALENYTKSYASIIDKNKGASRFKNYDLYSTFKIDKDSTIQFLEDFLKLNLYNNEKVTIRNNTLLTLFNIFDSRIYFDILYDILPESEKRKQTENDFVTSVRARINSNSRKVNLYQTEEDDKPLSNSKEVLEYTARVGKTFGEMSHEDIRRCDAYKDLLHMELACMDDAAYNNGVSLFMAESFFAEFETGEAPAYLKRKFRIDDSVNNPKPSKQKSSSDNDDDTSEEDEEKIPDYIKSRLEANGEREAVEEPFETPANDINDLATSVDTKLNSDPKNLNEALGSGFEKRTDVDRVNIVINYTDNSMGKKVYVKDSLNGATVSGNPSGITNSWSPRNRATNNSNNSISASDTKDIQEHCFSNGRSIEDVFAFLESEEPLSDKGNTTKPKGDLLSTSMDIDRKTLPLQQKGKKALQRSQNIGKAITRPFTRLREWVNDMYDELIAQSEDKVKERLMEDESYRGTIRKLARFALKLGMFSIFTHVNGLLAAAYAGVQIANKMDEPRLRRELQADAVAELKVIQQKIDDCRDNEEKYRLIREREQIKKNISKSAGKYLLWSAKDVL